MAEFLQDPWVLTTEKLKRELVAHNVPLPAGQPRKDVYVQLYLQHLTARNRPPLAAGADSQAPPDLSGDEERKPSPVLTAPVLAAPVLAAAGRSRRVYMYYCTVYGFGHIERKLIRRWRRDWVRRAGQALEPTSCGPSPAGCTSA
ncbi:lamina-associated polypeptide 2, isoforms beta/delta/epsilon/gamma-like isoform X2 [Myotis myotis]|uniref:lamina-associated polypeptide 2, isoforms beta/delta/epsilon/gamma-like isoform X2 n=1 Tax=Myotis myotis TaxID=51298 RepID=UPI00174AB0C7|nr:lamina-associated polypeptide 2, isoforms beta/delta/epsilon/gamma-like isoform X2 [Myotis myotis]